jgi:type I restriction enzyme S subunit
MSWKQVRLGEILNISKGKKHKEAPFDNSNYRYISIEDLNGGNEKKYTNEKGTIVKENDVIITWDGANAGKVGVGFNGVIGSTLARLHLVGNGIDPRFLFWYLDSKVTSIKSQRIGATIPHINGSVLKDLLIPIPPLSTQKHIAEILDKADALRRKDQALMKKYDELAKALFIDMFGDPVKNERGWKIKRLSDVVNPDRIITYGIVQAGENIKDGVPYIRTGDIKNGKILTTQLLRTSTTIANSYKRSQVNIGDIVMSIRATVGTVALLPNELDGANLTQGTARISPGNSINRQYLYWYLKSDAAQRWISINSKGATFREITLTKLRELPILGFFVKVSG